MKYANTILLHIVSYLTMLPYFKRFHHLPWRSSGDLWHHHSAHHTDVRSISWWFTAHTHAEVLHYLIDDTLLIAVVILEVWWLYIFTDKVIPWNVAIFHKISPVTRKVSWVVMVPSHHYGTIPSHWWRVHSVLINCPHRYTRTIPLFGWYPSNDNVNHGSVAITVQCHYNAVDFLQNYHKRHPIARPLGRDMGCLLWVTNLHSYPATVTAEMWIISCFTGPCFNGTQLY